MPRRPMRHQDIKRRSLIELNNNSILIVTVDVFWRAAKIPGSILRPQTPLSYPSQKKNSAERCDSWNCAKICAKKNAVNFKIRPL
jgi:hypothetical protein